MGRRFKRDGSIAGWEDYWIWGWHTPAKFSGFMAPHTCDWSQECWEYQERTFTIHTDHLMIFLKKADFDSVSWGIGKGLIVCISNKILKVTMDHIWEASTYPTSEVQFFLSEPANGWVNSWGSSELTTAAHGGGPKSLSQACAEWTHSENGWSVQQPSPLQHYGECNGLKTSWHVSVKFCIWFWEIHFLC